MNSRYAALLGECTMLMNSRGKFPFKHNFSESIHSFSLNKRKICTLLQISTNKTSNVNPKKSSECLTIHSNINCFPQKKNGLNSEKWKKLNSWAAFWIYHNKWDLVGDSGGLTWVGKCCGGLQADQADASPQFFIPMMQEQACG